METNLRYKFVISFAKISIQRLISKISSKMFENSWICYLATIVAN